MCDQHAIDVNVKVPLPPGGFVQVRIRAGDVRTIAPIDQRFILDLLAGLSVLAGRDITQIEAAAEPAVTP